MTIGEIVNKILANNLDIRKADIARHINEHRATLNGYLKKPGEPGYRRINPCTAWKILNFLNASYEDKSKYLSFLEIQDWYDLYSNNSDDKSLLSFINKNDKLTSLFLEFAQAEICRHAFTDTGIDEYGCPISREKYPHEISEEEKKIIKSANKILANSRTIIEPEKKTTTVSKYNYPIESNQASFLVGSEIKIIPPFDKEVDFIIEAKDDSLSPIIPEGSLIGIIRAHEIFPDKPMLVASIDETGYKFEIKYVKKNSDSYELISLNKQFKKIIPREQFKVVGLVVNIYKDL